MSDEHGKNIIHAESIVNSRIRQGNREDPGFRYLKLSPKGILTGSLIAPLKAMEYPRRAQLAFALEDAAEKLRADDIAGALWPLGDALDMLGFTVEKR